MSPAVGHEIIRRLMPKQNPQPRRIRLAAEVATVGQAKTGARPFTAMVISADAGGGQAPALQLREHTSTLTPTLSLAELTRRGRGGPWWFGGQGVQDVMNMLVNEAGQSRDP